MSSMAKLVISVDVEDWAQSTWDHSLEISARAQRNTELVLDILGNHGKTVTMFVLGKFAEQFPSTVRRIAEEGHEVGSHGYGHIEVFSQTPEEFRQDAVRAKQYLEDLIGRPVLGYRAPDFSIVRKTIWALDVLAELGFQYDSSIYPIRSKRYGIHDWPMKPTRVRLSSGRSIVELPVSTLGVLGRRWPIAGGGYHRLLPWPVIRAAITRTVRAGSPFISYCHPYEFDAAEFAVLKAEIPLLTRLHQGIGRAGFQAKFERMLGGFETAQASQIALGKKWPEYALQAF